MKARDRQGYSENEAVIAWRTEVVAERGESRGAGFDVASPGIAEWISREAAVAWVACGAFEWVALGYLAMSSALIVLFAENLAHPLRLVGVQVFVAGVILILCWAEASTTERAIGNNERQSDGECLPAGRTGKNVCPTNLQKVWHFWRHWYPHLFFLFCFEELGKLVHLIAPCWQDAKLIAAD